MKNGSSQFSATETVFVVVMFLLNGFPSHKCAASCDQSSYICTPTHTGFPRRNVPDFGRVFLMLNYTDITQNTYIQS